MKLVQAEVDRKIAKYEFQLQKRCQRKLFNEAKAHVDSLVLNEVNVLDTVRSPARPTRPKLDKKIILNDSTAISPFIK